MSSSAIPGDHPLWRAAAPGSWQSAQLLSHSGVRLILAFLWPSAVLAIARPSFGRSFSPRRLAIILFCSGCSGTSSALIDRSAILGGYMVFVLSFLFLFFPSSYHLVKQLTPIPVSQFLLHLVSTHYCSPLLGGYGARTHGVYQHPTLNGKYKKPKQNNYFFTDTVDAVCHIATMPTSSMLSLRRQCLIP